MKKELFNNLHAQLEAFRFFDEQRLSALKIGVDLQIALRDLEDLNNSELNEAIDVLRDAKNKYDNMYSKYEIASIKLDALKNDISALSRYVVELENGLKTIE